MSNISLTQIRGIPIMPHIPELPFTQGNIWHVKPSSGSDSNYGDHPDSAWKTLDKCMESNNVKANQNDIVLKYAESNTAGSTTDYQATTLDWSKDLVHLIGVGGVSPLSQRARVAFSSTYDTASNLFTLSADGCLIKNIAFFAGVAGTNPTGCVQITGDRSRIVDCHIAGIGHANNDIADAYSLYLNGVEETLFERCFIGLNTIDAGTGANSEILMANTVKNVTFDSTLIYRRIEHATNHPLVKVAAATSLDEFIIFRNGCGFLSTATNNAYSNASPFKFVASPTQGFIVIDPTCWMSNGTTAGKWDVDDYNRIIVTGADTPAADTAQIGRYV